MTIENLVQRKKMNTPKMKKEKKIKLYFGIDHKENKQSK